MRTHARVPTVSGVSLKVDADQTVACKLENLSASGALISGASVATWLQAGQAVEVQIPLAGREQLCLAAQIVREQHTPEGPPALGLQFVNPPEDLERMLDRAFEEALRRVTSQVVGNVRTDLLK